jgi:ribosomal protein S12 methylthiotransferase accessory factor
MESLSSNKYKEAKPGETIDKLIGILKDLGIEMEEKWLPDNNLGTYSLRITIKGTEIGTNGKGMSKEYARASAYAEFFERLQNVKLQPNATFYNLLRNNNFDFQLFPDEVFINLRELRSSPIFNILVKELKLSMEDTLLEPEKALKAIQKIDYSLFLKRDMVLCIPYYSVRTKKVVNLPYFSSNLHYGSNGMCAGNTPYEALVQGLSEIIERMIQTKIIMEMPGLPDIPEAFLERYPEILTMYKRIKQMKNYHILLKDCSFGGKYPAAALILIEKNTGRYGVKLGCNPDYGIALERLFTEATQGVRLEDYAKKTVFDFENHKVKDGTNLLNGFRTGDSVYPYQIFSEESEFTFTAPEEVSSKSNKEILSSLIKLFTEDGYDILIRDVSYLDFPSYHIVVPGISEMKHPDTMDYEADHTRLHVQRLINQPELITKENCRYVISVVDYYKYSLNANKLRHLSGFLPNEKFPGKEYDMDNYYYVAMCYVYLENYKAAYEVMKKINKSIVERFFFADVKYTAMEYYLSGMAILHNHDKVMQYIRKLYDEEISSELYNIFKNPSEVLTKQYKSIDISSIRREEADSEYLAYEKVNKIFKEKQKENIICQQRMESLFEDFH